MYVHVYTYQLVYFLVPRANLCGQEKQVGISTQCTAMLIPLCGEAVNSGLLVSLSPHPHLHPHPSHPLHPAQTVQAHQEEGMEVLIILQLIEQLLSSFVALAIVLVDEELFLLQRAGRQRREGGDRRERECLGEWEDHVREAESSSLLLWLVRFSPLPASYSRI